MNDVQLFTNQLFGNVRTIIDDQGNPWFVGSDVASCLGYKYPANAIQDHVDEEDKIIPNDGVDKSTTPPIIFTDSMGRQQIQYPIWINESGLYSLIFGSKLPNAKQFKHWVTSEVLPTMRKLGFDNSLQMLKNQVLELQQQNQLYMNSNAEASTRAAYNGERLVQMVEKTRSIQDGTPLTPELKQFITHFDENWEG